MYDPPNQNNTLVSLFIFQEIVHLEPNLWMDSNYTGLYFSPHNRSAVVTFCLHLTPNLSLLISHHTALSLALSILYICIYSKETPYGFYIRKFVMTLPARWASQVFKLRITTIKVNHVKKAMLFVLS